MPGFQEACPCIPLIGNHLDELMVKLGGGSGNSENGSVVGCAACARSEVLALFSSLAFLAVVPGTPQ